MLLHLYASYAWPLNANQTKNNNNLANGGLNGNGHVLPERRVRDAEEFELEGLMSDDEVSEESSAGGRRKEGGRPS